MHITRVGSVLVDPFWVLVKVETDAGITGYGEAYHGAGVHQIAVDEELLKTLIGQDPRNVNRLFSDMMGAMWGLGYHLGAAMSAISGIEMALWDITGQACDLPIWCLLGGRYRESVRIYCDCHAGDEETPEAYSQRAREVEASGFSALKFDIDPLPQMRDRYSAALSNAEVRHYVDVVTAIRDALGSNTDLAIDAHWCYSPVDILKVARRLEGLDLLWLEDPIPPENIDALARLKAATSVPICTGENLYARFGFRSLIFSQAADIVSPDLAKAGGLAEGKRIAELAQLYYIQFAPHNICSPIGTYAAAHVCAAVPNFLALEYHHHENPSWPLFLDEPHIIQNGYIEMTDRPGLGVSVNEEYVRQVSKENLGFFL